MRITPTFVLLIGTAVVGPLAAFWYSIGVVRNGTTASAREANRRAAEHVAAQVSMYLQHNIDVLGSVGAKLASAGLTAGQRQKALKEYAERFSQLREVTLFSRALVPVGTSAVGQVKLRVPTQAQGRPELPYIAPVTIDNDLLPITTIALRLPLEAQDADWVVGEIALDQMWSIVDMARVGSRGFALVVGEDGRLIAHGNPGERIHIAEQGQPRAAKEIEYAAAFRAGSPPRFYIQDGQTMLAVAAPVSMTTQGRTPWLVIVEEPLIETTATARRVERHLLGAFVLAALSTLVLGYLMGNRLIQRLFALNRFMRKLEAGHYHLRLEMAGHDEIKDLADSASKLASTLQQHANAAFDVQRRLIPAEFSPTQDVSAKGVWEPARVVSGDYYDMIQCQSGSMTFCIADVVGKGMPAALLMASTQAAVHFLMLKDLQPSALCGELNEFLCSIVSSDKYVTFAAVRFEPATKVLMWSSAGHPSPLLISSDGVVRRLSGGGIVLGIERAQKYQQGTASACPGDRVVMFTDGVTEAEDSSGAFFDEDGLLEVVRSCRTSPAAETCRIISNAVHTFTTELRDDLTVLVVDIH